MENLITVAVIQCRSEPGCKSDNLKGAEELIQKAQREKVDIALLPELFASGYIPNGDIKSYGETEEGEILLWLCKQAKKSGLYLGGGLAIYSMQDLYNRYYIIGPRGKILGFAQKKNGEAYCFKRGVGKHFISTPIGKLAIGICGDNHYSDIISQFQNRDIDLLLMPHAWPNMDKCDMDEKTFTLLVNKILGVPTIFVNPVGKMGPMKGILGILLNRSGAFLRGRSCIIQADGQVSAALGSEPDIAIAEIKTYDRKSSNISVPNYQGMIHPGSFILRRLIIPLDLFFGKWFYKKQIRLKIDSIEQ